MRAKAGLTAAVLVAAAGLVGCGQDTRPQTVGEAIRLSPDSPTASAQSATAPTAGPAASVVDRTADIDVDDQAGDGRSVRIESVRTGRVSTRIVIIDPATGAVLGSDVLTPGVQLVTVRLDEPVRVSGELLAQLVVDNGTGATDVVIDDEGEAVEEDFDYELR